MVNLTEDPKFSQLSQSTSFRFEWGKLCSTILHSNRYGCGRKLNFAFDLCSLIIAASKVGN